MRFTSGTPRPANAGRRKGSRNRRTIVAESARNYPDGLAYLVKVMQSENDPLVTPDMRLKAAISISQYQHPKPTPVEIETFISLDYVAPKSPQEARDLILSLGERATRGEISVQAHELLIANLKAYLTDKAAEQEKKLTALENHVRYGAKAPWETSTNELNS